MLMLQAIALAWFCLAARPKPLARHRQSLQSQLAHYTREHRTYAAAHIAGPLPATVPISGWRAATVTSMLISMVLLACLTLASGHAGIAAHVIQASR